VYQSKLSGYFFTVKDVFTHPTVEGLAKVVKIAEVPSTGPTSFAGSLSLSPIQRWFFAHSWESIHHFNQSYLLKPKIRIELSFLKSAMNSILQHHDILKCRYQH